MSCGAFASEAAHGAGASEALPPAAPVLFHIGPLPVNNSMVLMWVVAAVIIFVARAATKNIQHVPTGLQNFAEWIVDNVSGRSSSGV